MKTNSTQQKHIIVARRVAAGWLEVVEQFTPPEGDITYPYMRAAYANAQARSTGSVAEFHACLLRSPICTGHQFNRLTENATFIDIYTLQSAKPA